MTEIQIRQRFALPPERAWESLVAFDRYPEWIESYEAVEFVGTQHEGVGTRWRQTRTVFGRSHSQVMEVTSWEGPRSFALVAEESGARYETRYELAPVEGGTEVVMTFSVTGTNPLSRVFVRTIGRRLLRGTGEAMARDLEDLAAVAGG